MIWVTSLHAAENSTEAAQLAKVTNFVQRQLLKTGIVENPDEIGVKFGDISGGLAHDGYQARCYYIKKTYAIVKNEILVPKSLLTVLADKDNNQAFNNNKKFKCWLMHAKRSPAHIGLYQPVIQAMSNKRYGYHKAKALFNEQRKKNYRTVKAVIDHEATHIREEHTIQLLKHENATLVGATLLSLISTYLGGELKPKTAVVVTPILVYSIVGIRHLLNKYFRRSCELEADRGVRPKKTILLAAADTHKACALAEKPFHCKNRIANLTADHPTNATRASLFYKCASECSN